ncbi:MAG: TetR/AcrR family transcriptional regulator [Allosphingosinicella sp.]|uniref:TetR/AcrR family transcriptional regulator n=1 Tax=Allosphingosinicella sp. TaxID=2823234 RepID=UPI00395337B3
MVHPPPSPPACRRRRRKDARPGELLDAARAAFVENGFALTKMEDIARRAGVSKGTVYLYYPTKEGLFEAVVRADFLPLIERLRTLIESDPEMSAVAQLQLIGETMYREIAGTDRRLLTHLVIAEGRRFPWLAEFYHREIMSQGKALIRSVLERGAARGEFAPGGLVRHPEILMAPTIVAALFAILFAPHEAFDMEDYRHAHVELVLRGLLGGGPPFGN